MEKLYGNGRVYLGDEDLWAEAVVTSDNKITFVGSLEDAIEAFPLAERVDLNGNYMFPGFIDAHAHVIGGAYFNSGILLDIEMTRDEVFETIAEFIKENPDKSSYFGLGYPESEFDGIGPTKEMLDTICSDKPIIIGGSSGHEGFCNSMALKLAGINSETEDPVPGFQFFYRYKNGTPTGRFAEAGPYYMLMEKIDFFPEEKVKGWIEEVLGYFSSIGITTIVDCGTLAGMGEDGFPVLFDIAASGELTQRVICCESVATKEEIDGAVERLKEASNEYKVKDIFEFKTLKIINDGTFESATASLIEPYTHNRAVIEPMLEGDELNKICLEAASAGFDIHIHGIGDRAIRAVVGAAKSLRENGYQKTRITNAHTQLVAEEDIHLFGKYNLIANTTGAWHYGNNESRELIGDRQDRFFAMRKLINSGAIITLGSDFPADEIGANPVISMEVAITRQSPGKPESDVLQPEDQKLTMKEVVDGYTINAAYAIGMEDKLGSIEVGKYADFTVFNQNPFDTEKYNIHKIAVDMTIMNGNTTFKAEEVADENGHG